jgi:hypothetical protein
MSEVAHAAPTASEYIVHHLTHWQNKPQTEIVDFSVFNLDSLFFSITLGLLGSFFPVEGCPQGHIRCARTFPGCG